MGMSQSSSVLILFAHPALEKSRVNKVLIEAVRRLKGITLHDLYELYPDFHIDVRREQQMLVRHDTIIMQFPFFWYSSPALIKEWEDMVLEHGWAYGKGGIALQGKKFMCVLSTGGSEGAYRKGRSILFTIRQFLTPFEQMAHLCGMDFLPPFVVHGTYALTPAGNRSHAEDYVRLVTALREGKLNDQKLKKIEWINPHLDAVIME
jgi:glutathione-regulated potassium-efflux system ancillary protein KefG